MQKQKFQRVHYDTVTRNAELKKYRFVTGGTRHQLPGLKDGRYVHWVTLSDLKPNTEYHFVISTQKNTSSREYRFRTLPNDASELHFITGGDMGVDEKTLKILEQAGKQKPMFGVIGGDIAYADGNLDDFQEWDLWFDNWAKYMDEPRGMLTPLVFAVGNHEVYGGFGKPPSNAPFYFGYLAQGGRSYFSRCFGQNMVLYVLDSGHVADFGGEQALWMEREMEKYRHKRVRLAVYHVPLYPSKRPFDHRYGVEGRKQWLPIFDRFKLMTAFENHDHAHKRTKRLKNNRVDPMGTLYLGDGCFGRTPREIGEKRRWYEAKATPAKHFWNVKVNEKSVIYQAIGVNGEIIDAYVQEVP